MSWRKIAAFALTAALLLGETSQSASATTVIKQVRIQPVSVQLTFDGSKLQTPAGQFVFNYQGTTYVPLRFLSYALQKNVEWDVKQSQVTISNPTEIQMVAIKERLLNASKSTNAPNSSTTAVSIAPVDVKYVFNGETKSAPKGQVSFIYNGTIYVPMRFVAESTGSVINWDPKAKAITGASPSYLKESKETAGTPGASNPGTTPPGSNTDGKGNVGQTPGTPAGQGGSAGGAGGGTTSPYDSITTNTEAKLRVLEDKSKSVMWDLANQYLKAADSATKKQLLTKGQQQLDSLTVEFESIVTSAEQQLKAGGYNTDIIKQYRAEFDKQIEAGKELAKSVSN